MKHAHHNLSYQKKQHQEALQFWLAQCCQQPQAGVWSPVGCGLWKTSSLVLDILITVLLALAQSCSNYSSKVQFVFSGTKRLVSSAYFNNLLLLDLGCKSLSIITYKDGPISDPCTIDMLIWTALDKVLWTLHICSRPVKKRDYPIIDIRWHI